MEMIQFVMIAAAAMLAAALLKQQLPAYSILCVAAAAVLMTIKMADVAQPVLHWLSSFKAGADEGSAICLLKASGIAMVAQNMQDLCKDEGMSLLANKIELAARCLIVLEALPMFNVIIQELRPFLE